MGERLQAWWTLDPLAQRASAPDALAPPQRRDACPMPCVACGPAILITGPC
jgi:hypothetical protein